MTERAPLAQTEAANIARDAQTTRGLSDAECECLQDVLASDELFVHLVTAQQAAIDAAYHADHRDFDDLETLARKGATPLGEAIDDVVEGYIEDVGLICDLADACSTSWTVATKLYYAGYRDSEAVRTADLHELIADSGIAPTIAEAITTHE